jgi:hypothetical protein
MSERAEQLRSLERTIRDAAEMRRFLRSVDRACADCGVEYFMDRCARYCDECAERRRAEANREAQRRRRQRETRQRRLAAGVWKRTEHFLVGAAVACANCGETFPPERTTARYCSTRCRVAAHRAKKRGAK